MSKIPSGIEMPNRKKQGPVGVDLLRPGNGTPWEDRGTSGSISAYFKTVIKSFTSPGLLMDHIRRLEVTTDSTRFALVSAAMWAVGILVWNAFWLFFVLPTNTVYRHELAAPMNYWLFALIQAALVSGGIFLWLKVGPKLYMSLAGAELPGTTATLVGNCFAYSMGPSLLAVLPIWAPPPFRWVPWAIAAAWVHFDLVVAGKRRLYLKSSSAIINVVLIALCVLAISVVGYYVCYFLWSTAVEMNGLELQPPPVVEKINH